MGSYIPLFCLFRSFSMQRSCPLPIILSNCDTISMLACNPVGSNYKFAIDMVFLFMGTSSIFAPKLAFSDNTVLIDSMFRNSFRNIFFLRFLYVCSSIVPTSVGCSNFIIAVLLFNHHICMSVCTCPIFSSFYVYLAYF